MTTLPIAFLPLAPLAVLIAIALGMMGLHGWDVLQRRRGSVLRILGSAVVLFALAGPHVREQTRHAQPDHVAIVVDHSASMARTDPAHHADQIAQNMARYVRALGMQPDVSTLVDDVTGTPLTAAIRRAVARIPAPQLAGVLVITDGLGHDLNAAITAPAPVHGLIVGDPNAVDVRTAVRRAPRTAAVGSRSQLEVVLEGNRSDTPFTIHVNDTLLGTFSAHAETPLSVTVPISRRMAYDIRVETPVSQGDLNPDNNRTEVTITGVHDRLRVLLITGTPYPGVRAWRNLLTSDPMVDLVHFTILRTPAHEDFTPADDLSLIAFPTQALFSDALSSFDLVIFDRYRQTGVLSPQYLANIAARVTAGGAMLVVSGPEDAAGADDFSRFSGLPRLSEGPLAAVLPVVPRTLVEGTVLPHVSPAGRAHPITTTFSGETWGPWSRYVMGSVRTGKALLQAQNGDPLLVVAHAGQGRVAMIMSDQAWVWARGFEGGGPYNPLMRRLIHWLMDEPDLDENRLLATVDGADVVITRHSLDPIAAPVVVTQPDGTTRSLVLNTTVPGIAMGRMKASQAGVYRLAQSGLKTSVTIGTRQSIEDRDGPATPNRLRATLAPKQGFVTWAKDVHDLRAVQTWAPHHGPHWLGLTPRHASTVVRDDLRPLSPVGLLILALCLWGLAWWREGR
jgi:uncharacterized membrane protein